MYPMIKKRYKFFGVDDGFFLLSEYNEYMNFKTKVSELFFHDNDKNEPVYVDGIETINFKIRQIKRGSRANYIRVACMSILFNSPFIRYFKLLEYCLELNKLSFSHDPMEEREITRLVDDMFSRWINGRILFNNLETGKNVFWSRYCNLPRQEKRFRGQQLYYSTRRKKYITRIEDAYKSIKIDSEESGNAVSVLKLSQISDIAAKTIYLYKSKGLLQGVWAVAQTPSVSEKGITFILPVSPSNIYTVDNVTHRKGITLRKDVSESLEIMGRAIKELSRTNTKVTQKAISIHTGYNILKIKRYWKHVQHRVKEINQNNKK